MNVLWYFISGWAVIDAIDSLMRKAGYNGMITEALRKRIKLTRYQSTLFTMHYSDYVAYVKSTRGSAPVIAGAKPVNHWFGSKTFQFQNHKNLVGVQREPKIAENLNILVVIVMCILSFKLILHYEEKTETLVQNS